MGLYVAPHAASLGRASVLGDNNYNFYFNAEIEKTTNRIFSSAYQRVQDKMEAVFDVPCTPPQFPVHF